MGNRFSGSLRNVASASVDPARMKLDFVVRDGATFGFTLEVDGPTRLRLAGALRGDSLLDDLDGLGRLRFETDGDDLVVVMPEAGTYGFQRTRSQFGTRASLTFTDAGGARTTHGSG